MTKNPLRAFYSNAPIKSLGKLAEVLDVAPLALADLAASADALYRPVPQKKKDGTLRMTWDAYPQLKAVHQKIKNRLLIPVRYPLYLQGGIRDRNAPRDYARNAAIHAGQRCVFNEDVENFFPSIGADKVRDIWESFFRFTPSVSDVLTKLTTRGGELPQGARTSSYLANLAFWRTEPELVRYLHALGYRYSRLIDDVTVSSARPLSARQKTQIISLIYAFFERDGFRPKYAKHRIYKANERMLVNNLVVNAHPSLPDEQRKGIRSLVHYEANANITDVQRLARVRGKVALVARFHPSTAKRLADTLKSGNR